VAEVVEVVIDHDSRRPIPWPAAFRTLFEKHLARRDG
jgi:acyl-CoA thioesterase FadM